MFYDLDFVSLLMIIYVFLPFYPSFIAEHLLTVFLKIVMKLLLLSFPGTESVPSHHNDLTKHRPERGKIISVLVFQPVRDSSGDEVGPEGHKTAHGTCPQSYSAIWMLDSELLDRLQLDDILVLMMK